MGPAKKSFTLLFDKLMWRNLKKEFGNFFSDRQNNLKERKCVKIFVGRRGKSEKLCENYYYKVIYLSDDNETW